MGILQNLAKRDKRNKDQSNFKTDCLFLQIVKVTTHYQIIILDAAYSACYSQHFFVFY